MFMSHLHSLCFLSFFHSSLFSLRSFYFSVTLRVWFLPITDPLSRHFPHTLYNCLLGTHLRLEPTHSSLPAVSLWNAFPLLGPTVSCLFLFNLPAHIDKVEIMSPWPPRMAETSGSALFQDLRPEHLYAQTKDPRAEFFLVTFPVN